VKHLIGAIDAIFNMLSYLTVDMEALLEGSRALLTLNSVLAAMKAVLANAMKFSLLLTYALKRRSLYLCDLWDQTQLDLIFFGDCVPSKNDIRKERTIRDLHNNQDKSVRALREESGYSAADLKLAFKASEIWEGSVPGGYSLTELREAKFELRDLCSAGVPVDELIKDDRDKNRYTVENLRSAGYTARDLKESRFSAEFGADALWAAGFTAEELRGKKDGKKVVFTASELKTISDMTVQMLKEGGFTVTELKKAVFTPSEIKSGGFDATQMHEARFTAKELKDARFSAEELKPIFNLQELRTVFSANELKGHFSASQLKKVGYLVGELYMAGISVQDLKLSFTAADLRAELEVLEEQLDELRDELRDGGDGAFDEGDAYVWYQRIVDLEKQVAGLEEVIEAQEETAAELQELRPKLAALKSKCRALLMPAEDSEDSE